MYTIDNYVVKEIFPFDNLKSGLEQVWVEIKYKRKNIAIGSLYRPPNKKKRKSRISDFIEDLDNIFNSLYSKYDLIIGGGDLNIDQMNSSNPLAKCLNSYNFQQLIKEPTRITEKKSSLLDVLFINCSTDMIKKSGTTSADGVSDHHLVFGEIELVKDRFRPKIICYRDFKYFNRSLFLQTLEEQNWYRLIEAKDINAKVEFLNCFILNSYNEHAPLKQSKVTRPPSPWLNDQVRSLIRQRDKALANFKATKSSENWYTYKQLRNKTLQAVRKAKKTMFTRILKKSVLRAFGML